MCQRIYRNVFMLANLLFLIYDILLILKRGNYFSKKNIKPVASGRRLRILGNGNSLNDVNLEESDSVDYMVVNRHILSDNYISLKPTYYVLADPHFFEHPEGISVLQQISEKTSWPMTLCIPFSNQTKKVLPQIMSNKQINFIYYNATSISCQLKFIRYICYSWQLTMPVVQNVLVASIMLGLIYKYSTIELYGVDHSWTKYLYVDRDNVVYLENPHFFDKQKVMAKPLKEIQHTDEYPFYLILKNYSRMFESYWEIKKYIFDCHIPCMIINKSHDSFIDAFVKE